MPLAARVVPAAQDASGWHFAHRSDGELAPLQQSGMFATGVSTPSTGEPIKSHIRADQLARHYPY